MAAGHLTSKKRYLIDQQRSFSTSMPILSLMIRTLFAQASE